MIENQSPELAARIDLLLLAIATIVKQSGSDDAFESAMRANVATWQDPLIAQPVKEEYLHELDGQLTGLLAMIRG